MQQKAQERLLQMASASIFSQGSFMTENTNVQLVTSNKMRYMRAALSDQKRNSRS